MNRSELTNSTTHYKMYKSGRKWMFAGLTAVTLLTATGAVAHADETQQTSNNATEVTANTNSNSNNTDSSAADNVASQSANTSSNSEVVSATVAASNVKLPLLPLFQLLLQAPHQQVLRVLQSLRNQQLLQLTQRQLMQLKLQHLQLI